MGLTALCSSCDHHRWLWMDPHAVWVDLEPPLAAARSGPAMTTTGMDPHVIERVMHHREAS
jgi:hypothetical protein